MVGLILNNVFIQALHIVVGEKVLNTLTNHAMCTIAFGAILTVVYFVCKTLLIFTSNNSLPSADTCWIILAQCVFSGYKSFVLPN